MSRADVFKAALHPATTIDEGKRGPHLGRKKEVQEYIYIYIYMTHDLEKWHLWHF